MTDCTPRGDRGEQVAACGAESPVTGSGVFRCALPAAHVGEHRSGGDVRCSWDQAPVAVTDYEQVRTTLGFLLSALRSGERMSTAVEEEFAKGLAALKRLAGKVEA